MHQTATVSAHSSRSAAERNDLSTTPSRNVSHRLMGRRPSSSLAAPPSPVQQQRDSTTSPTSLIPSYSVHGSACGCGSCTQRVARSLPRQPSGIAQLCQFGHPAHEDLTVCPDGFDYSGLPAEVRELIINNLPNDDILNFRTLSRAVGQDVSAWGARRIESILQHPEQFLANAPTQPGTPYPDIRGVQHRIAVAATAAASTLTAPQGGPFVQQLNNTLGPQSSAAPNVAFRLGGGFTLRTPIGSLEAHPGGGQHSGRTNKRAALPSTLELGGAYIRTDYRRLNEKKNERRFGKYGEFTSRENFWDPLNSERVNDRAFVDNLRTEYTGALIARGIDALNAQDNDLLQQIQAELLRRYEESSAKKKEAKKDL